jgi:hypothetical protein
MAAQVVVIHLRKLLKQLISNQLFDRDTSEFMGLIKRMRLSREACGRNVAVLRSTNRLTRQKYQRHHSPNLVVTTPSEVSTSCPESDDLQKRR